MGPIIDQMVQKYFGVFHSFGQIFQSYNGFLVKVDSLKHINPKNTGNFKRQRNQYGRIQLPFRSRSRSHSNEDFHNFKKINIISKCTAIAEINFGRMLAKIGHIMPYKSIL